VRCAALCYASVRCALCSTCCVCSVLCTLCSLFHVLCALLCAAVQQTDVELDEINACGYQQLCVDEIARYRCPVVDCNGTLVRF
jgi:hypothetical protein